jgi:hypothetical protein
MSRGMKAAPWLLLSAVVIFGSGCARTDWIDRTLVTVDLAGVWSGKAYIAHAVAGLLVDVRMELEQAGPKVKGSIRPSGSIPWRDLDRSPTAGSLEGTVAGDVFEFKETNGHVKGRLTVSGDGDEMAGEVVERATYWVVLRRAR